MSQEKDTYFELRVWSERDFPLLERIMGDPEMTVHLGGTETVEQIRKRHQRYYQLKFGNQGQMFVILVGSTQAPAGSIGYWEKSWRSDLVWETGWSVLPEFQGLGVATWATTAIIEKARAEERHRFLHAYPSINNAPSNAICKKVGFTLLGEVDFEYPLGNLMRCNDWQFDLFATR